MQRIRSVREGDEIRTQERDEEGAKEVRWKVLKVYANHVLAAAGSSRRCISYGDLIRMGLERQEDMKELIE